jgi:exosortase A-associated hydrolase 2
MLPASVPPAPQPFFLEGREGQRFCLYTPPAGACRGTVLYLHPFGDEMNKARRVAALQARALAAAGHAVLQLDLHGCGDSSGEFGEARWDTWQDDVARASAWLRARHAAPLALWGLRLGALLALDCAAQVQPARLLLWQPPQNGTTLLTQFLRIRMANEMLADGADAGAGSGGTKALREALRAGEALEVGGYELSPQMADALDALDTAAMAVAHCPVHWIDVVADASRGATPVAKRIAAAWEAAGVTLDMRQVSGPAFWASQEIAECPALVEASSALFAQGQP